MDIRLYHGFVHQGRGPVILEGLRMRDADESLGREARLKPAQRESAASAFHGLKSVATKRRAG
jgi:hypothetical protein